MDSCPLSERELEILQLVADGLTNQQIAGRLYISVNTVKVHLRNIFDKLEVQSRTEAVMVAVREGWLSAREQGGEGPSKTVTSPPFAPIAAWQKALLAVSLILVGLLVALPWISKAWGRTGAVEALSDVASARSSFGVLSGSGRWSVRTSMPIPRSRLAVTAWDGLIYAIGGEAAGTVTGEVSVYDPVENRWESRSPKPIPVSNAGAIALEGKIYVPGGYTADGLVTDVLEIYDPAEDSWERGSPLPAPLCGYAIVPYGREIYLFGGWNGHTYTDVAYKYDPRTDRWYELVRMPTPRGFAGAAVINGRIYVVGGYDGSSELSVVEEYNPAFEGRGKAWESRSPMLMGRAGLGVAVVGQWLYAIGGGWERYLAFNERYDPQADLWTPFETPVLGEWRNLGVVALGNKIYVIGGWSGGPLGLVEEYQARYVIMLPVVK